MKFGEKKSKILINGSNLVGRIVWKIVERETENNTVGRAFFVLAGMNPEHLSGVSRMMPKELEKEGKVLFRIQKDINGLPDSLPKRHLTGDPAVHFRNSNAADIIVLAVSDKERQTVGASLESVPPIDRKYIQSQTSLWATEIALQENNAPGKKIRDWIESFLYSLDHSGAAENLNQFSEFVLSIQEKISRPWIERIQASAPALHLPTHCFTGIPFPEEDMSPQTKKEFRDVFWKAKHEISNFIYLNDSSGNRIDTEQLKEDLQKYIKDHKSQYNDEEKTAVQSIRRLIDDRRRIRHGDWLESQEKFCHTVNWNTFGKFVFNVKTKRPTLGLGGKTLKFINDEFPAEVDKDTGNYLQDLETKKTTLDQDHGFFDKWQDRLHANQKLYSAWQRHLCPDKVVSDDLQTAILDGIHALLVKAIDDDGKISVNAKIVIEAKQRDRLSSWSSLDKRVYALFRQEARLLQKILSNHIVFLFGKWLNENAISSAKKQTRKAALQIEFEMKFKSATDNAIDDRIRIIWKPNLAGTSSIAMAWPEDVNGLYESMTDDCVRVHQSTFSPKLGKGASKSPVSLQDTGSFVDVTRGEEGRTADPASSARVEDFFAVIKRELIEHEVKRWIDKTSLKALCDALEEFRLAFSRTIRKLKRSPDDLYTSGLVNLQAKAFGHLCSVAQAKLAAEDATRATTLLRISQFGIVTSEVPEQGAIITAWHPLRLLERQEKAKDLEQFSKTLLNANAVSSGGLKHACEERRNLYKKWFFPEIISVDFKSYITLEDCAGYSFSVPEETVSSDSRRFDSTASVASETFLSFADRYLELSPHEEGNFSTAIFNANSGRLPGLIAEGLKERINSNPYLRCNLLITHDQPNRMRNIYAKQNLILRQNVKLRDQDINEEMTDEFLSRLRVSIGKGDNNPHDGRRNNTDIVFLHDVFFKHAEITWNYLDGASKTLSDHMDLRDAAMPRRRTDETVREERTIAISLTAPQPPRSAAEFLDLCYVVRGKDAQHIPEGKRAVPLRRISWNQDGKVERTINKSHDMGNWIVSVDNLLSRQMLFDNGIKVIHDMPLRDSELRVLISSREPSPELHTYIENDFRNMEYLAHHDNPSDVANRAIAAVADVCGQKILTSTRSKTGAREIIGLAAAISLVCIEKAKKNLRPIWFSLDDNCSFFDLKKEKRADILALSISRNEAGRFVINMTVVEAKCAASAHEATAAKSSWEQVLSTLTTLKTNFVDQHPIAREAWGTQLLHLISLRPEYGRFFRSDDRNASDEFRRHVACGDVDYCIDGRSVIVVYDDISPSNDLEVNFLDHGQQHHVRQRALVRLMKVIDDPFSSEAQQISTPDASPATPSTNSHGRYSDKVLGSAQTEKCTSSESVSGNHQTSVMERADQETVKLDQKLASNAIKNPRIKPNLEQALHSTMTCHGSSNSKEEEAERAQTVARRLQGALTTIGMHADFTDDATVSTPNGVLVNFVGHSTLTEKKLQPKLSELKTTFGLGVAYIRPDLGRISIFIESRKRNIIHLDKVWLEAGWPKSCPDLTSSFLIGLREDNGLPLWLNLQDLHGDNGRHSPHTLIAGETGSGKGVLTQNLLLQMIAFNRPENFKLYIIDPKSGVDFFWISRAPHLAREIVTQPEESKLVLHEIVEEMNRRYELFEKIHVPKISEYNARMPEEEKLPLIMVVHDEMADWMAGAEGYKDVVRRCLTRLTSKARACGIHVIMITQRAANDAIPVGIRDNLGNRLCLRVAGVAGSKLALGVGGAERLLGMGHVAVRLGNDKPSGEEYFVAQVPFASTEDLETYARATLMKERERS